MALQVRPSFVSVLVMCDLGWVMLCVGVCGGPQKDPDLFQKYVTLLFHC